MSTIYNLYGLLINKDKLDLAEMLYYKCCYFSA